MRDKAVLVFKYVKCCHLKKKFVLWDPRRPMNGTDVRRAMQGRTFSRKSCSKMATFCIILCCFEEVGEPCGWGGEEFCGINFLG